MKALVIGTGAGSMRAITGDQSPAAIKDVITAAPVIEGARGRAWQADLRAQRQERGVRPEDDGTLVHWIIEAPWAHPVWHSYSLILVHLRSLLDARETLIYLDGATHELWLYAIDPAADRNKMLFQVSAVASSLLNPKNYASQIIEITDELALERVRAAVAMICEGKLSPDTDHVASWKRLFGDNMFKDRPNARPPRRRL